MEPLQPRLACNAFKEPWNVVEFFAGIGGMHFALDLLGLPSKVIAAYEISPHACATYALNHSVEPRQKSIEKLKPKDVGQGLPNLVWMMSPPCQPFTRNNRTAKRDLDDPRCAALKHLIHLVDTKQCEPQLLLLENVVGFETSQAHDLLLQVLTKTGYAVTEYILSPVDLGVPYERPRCFMLAVKHENSSAASDQGPSELKLQSTLLSASDLSTALGKCMALLPATAKAHEFGASLRASIGAQRPLAEYLVPPDDCPEELFLPLALLEKPRSWSMDIVTAKSHRAACFTKNYGSYVTGTGSIICNDPGLVAAGIPTKASNANGSEVKESSEEQKDGAQGEDQGGGPSFHSDWFLPFVGKLRYFHPTEVARIHGYGRSIQWPPTCSLKQKFGLLGNSLHAPTVAALLLSVLPIGSLPGTDTPGTE